MYATATYGTYQRINYQTVRLPHWSVSWNGGAVLMALAYVLVAVAFLAAMVALFAVVNMVVMPVVAVWCAAIIGASWKIAAVAVVFGFMWLVKPR